MLRDFIEANCEMKGDIEANTNNFVGIFSVSDFQYNNMLLSIQLNVIAVNGAIFD